MRKILVFMVGRIQFNFRKCFPPLRIPIFLVCLFFLSACFSKGNLDPEVSSGEKLKILRQRLIKKQNDIEDLKAENLVLRKMLDRNQGSRGQTKRTPRRKRNQKKDQRADLNLRPSVSQSMEEEGQSSVDRLREDAFRERRRKDLENLGNLENKNNDLKTFSKFFQEDISESDALAKGKGIRALDLTGSANKDLRKEDDRDLKILRAKNHFRAYKRARKAYKDLDLDRLRELSSISLEHFSDGAYTDDILFYLGRAYIKKNLYKMAIQTFDQLMSNYSESNREVSALFWTGVAYQRLNLMRPANSIFQRLIEEHPKSPEASFAKRKVERSKKSSLEEESS